MSPTRYAGLGCLSCLLAAVAFFIALGVFASTERLSPIVEFIGAVCFFGGWQLLLLAGVCLLFVTFVKSL